jgi:hypothetical protein
MSENRELISAAVLAAVSLAVWYALALFGHPMSAWFWCETLQVC